MKSISFTGVINAGGLATHMPERVAPLGENGAVLKALARVGDPPISLIEHHVKYHLDNGATNVIASVGPHEKVADHIKSQYRGHNSAGSFLVEHALGTGGDLLRLIRNREIAERIGSLIVITNVDTIADVNLQNLAAFHRRFGGGLTIALSSRRGVPHEDAYRVGSYHRVVYSDEASDRTHTEQDAMPFTVYRGSSTGVMVADTDFLRNVPWLPSDGSLSLYQDIVGYAVNQGVMTAFNNGDRFFMDVGTKATWEKVQEPGLLRPFLHYPNSSVSLSPILGHHQDT
ncbi:MAG TPA: hypothetical protein VGS08_03540 [Candidatus Saccharimonadales bacterium]|nr:hypothetical protein [Candidatus Saccharimonadales bacterium]